MIRSSVGALAPRFPGVRRIAVLRGGGLGDLVFAVPALDALRVAYPDAHITLLGAPSAVPVLAGRPDSPIDAVELPPPTPGVRDGEVNEAATREFVERMRERGFDLAVQMHGGGRNSNPFLLRLGAAATVGTATPDAPPLTRVLPYIVDQHEVLRWLEVAALAGAETRMIEPRLTASDAEREAGRRILPAAAPVLVVHPGASDARRRWPPDRFGAVVAALAARGVAVRVVGDASEAPIAHAVVAAAHEALPAERHDLVTSLAGTLTLPELLGVLAEADLVLADDSGPRHLAQAFGTPTVGLFWAGNALNAAPMSRGSNRVLLGWITACPVCGRDVTSPGWKVPRCEHDPSFLTDIETEDVLDAVRALLPA